MNLVLILREEAVSLVVILFLLYYSTVYRLYDAGKRFRWLCIFALGHVTFDIITIWTVNHLDTVPLIVNHICHVIFYLFAIMFCYVLLHFVIDIVYGPDRGSRLAKVLLLVPAIYLILIPFLPIEYLKGNGSNYSYGPCVFAGYACAASLFMISMGIILTHLGSLTIHEKRSLIPGLLVMTLMIFIQVVVPEVLFTGADVTIVTAGIFVAIVDPVGKYQHKAYFDLLTGLRNQNCYKDDVDHLRKELGGDVKKRQLICVICDINGLKEINDTQGHTAGDEYIRLAAKAMRESLSEAYAIYRIGGDEFCAIYIDKNRETVKAEIAKLRKQIGNSKATLHVPSPDRRWSTDRRLDERPYTISIGYAIAARGEDILKTVDRADKAMIEEKRRYYQSSEHDRRKKDIEQTFADVGEGGGVDQDA